MTSEFNYEVLEYFVSSKDKQALSIFFIEYKRVACYYTAWNNLSLETQTQLISSFSDNFPVGKQAKPQIPISNKKARANYQRKARNLTKLQDLDSLPNSDKPRVTGKGDFHSVHHYVIDHKVTVANGWKYNIPIEEIAHLCNLRWITGYENSKKCNSNFFDEQNQHLSLYLTK
jgi:hypothetical protein